MERLWNPCLSLKSNKRLSPPGEERKWSLVCYFSATLSLSLSLHSDKATHTHSLSRFFLSLLQIPATRWCQARAIILRLWGNMHKWLMILSYWGYKRKWRGYWNNKVKIAQSLFVKYVFYLPSIHQANAVRCSLCFDKVSWGRRTDVTLKDMSEL